MFTFAGCTPYKGIVLHATFTRFIGETFWLPGVSQTLSGLEYDDTTMLA